MTDIQLLIALLILLNVRERTQTEGGVTGGVEELRDWCCSSEAREFDVAVVTGPPVGDLAVLCSIIGRDQH